MRTHSARGCFFAKLAKFFHFVQNSMAMLTDAPPRKKNLKFFIASDRLNTLLLPADGKLPSIAAAMETAMKAGTTGDVGRACQEFISIASDFYQVPPCSVRVLAARPLRDRKHATTELFGDYHSGTKVIRVWMRTAVRKDVTSFGTFLSTLCHEFCHHLDFHKFPFGNSWHTRGFYQRTAMLYHYSKGTPVKQLVWVRTARRRWRIDWPQTNRANRSSSPVLR
jgi:hypothetical protein